MKPGLRPPRARAVASRPLMILLLLLASSALGLEVHADDDAKAVLTIDDYAKWQRLTSTAIAPNGSWVSYAYSPLQKDGVLHLRHLDSDKSFEIARGARPRFSDDGRWAIYSIVPPRKKGDSAGTGSGPQTGRSPTRPPGKTSGELVELETGAKTKWSNVDSYRFAKGSRLLAVRKRPVDAKAKHRGADLILRHLDQNHDELLGSVGEFAFNKAGTLLAYTVDAADGDGNGLYVRHVGTGERYPFHTSKHHYTKLTWSEEGTAIAVLIHGEKNEEIVHQPHRLVVVTGAGTDASVTVEYDPATVFDFPKEHVVSSLGSLSFDAQASRIFFGIKKQERSPKSKDKSKSSAKATSEKILPSDTAKASDDGGKPDAKKSDAEPPQPKPADVDIWHWKDERIQTVQKLQARRDRNRTDRAVFNLETHRFRRLTDDTMRSIEISRDGRWGIGRDSRAYLSDWKEGRADYYRVNIDSGERTLFLKEQGRTLGLSPDSAHFLYWRDDHVHLYHLPTHVSLNLTEKSPVSFVDREFDRHGTKPAYGVAGWSKSGDAILLNHRYDLYRQPLDGSPATNLTGIGTEREIRFRYVRTDREERFIDLDQPLLLSAYGQWTKKSGYYRHAEGKLEELIFADKRFGRITKAEHADRLVYSIESFRDYPDLYVSDLSFSFPQKVSNANPQQDEFRWGHRILFDYTNRDGVRLQGTLAIPDDYETGQRRPMLVNFYEKLSQNLHRYPYPRYSSGPQFAGYVSEGWLVMQPDIHFRTRTSHSDMHECIEAAVAKVVELGYADPKGVVLHGHSYSGQGAAYISTQTTTFAAIVAGAAATNLVSDFNQLWKSAGTSQHRYDIHGQGRFATNPYDDLELYLNQSAIHHVLDMNTPLLLLHGTEDGAVEWLQAVEFYNALRFNGKPVILLSYPGEGHGLRKFDNQIDFQKRMRAFFDHHARGREAAKWMTKGRPFLEKEKVLKQAK